MNTVIKLLSPVFKLSDYLYYLNRYILDNKPDMLMIEKYALIMKKIAG